MDRYKTLLENNRLWVREQLELDDQHFTRHMEGQHPPFLWIGCADSRVAPSEITGAKAGELFVHRNIANIVTHSDLNLMSVLEYGILTLRVDHIIVCGHTACGGVQAALGHRKLGIIDKWIRTIKDVYHGHQAEFEAISDETERWNHLVKMNVVEQVMNLAKTSFVQRRWHDEEFPIIHGWIYHMEDGHLEVVTRHDKDDPLDPIYRYEFDE